ncbi:ABC transporter [Petrotoga miotherma DSM 10691]|uniref:ABC transporter n=2 Tax=Petrotoga TaxID=28236 RepID=A0A2K1PF68_9BACT|nr:MULTISPECIES: ABC transporter ATP-binding protein [Petrotoga]PNS01317.1 ABC transporter [Petrotoga miotherma DSM 10691]POZ91027.1 ABC transporter [Petrotoga halophila DSM 16923]
MISIKNISFSYDTVRDTIKNISFTLNKGELIALLGPNGSGKTTILKCLNGTLKPKTGEIYIENHNIKNLSYKEIAKFISVVPQEHSAIFSYLVIDIVAMGITPYLSFGRMPTKKDYRTAYTKLEFFNIQHLAEKNYNQLSGGEKQLVLIARALMQNTDYLIMDEPTSHLDFKNQHLLMKELKKLSENGKSVITALHDPNLALRFCDRIIMVKNGEVIFSGENTKVMNPHNLQILYDAPVSMNKVEDVSIIYIN